MWAGFFFLSFLLSYINKAAWRYLTEKQTHVNVEILFIYNISITLITIGDYGDLKIYHIRGRKYLIGLQITFSDSVFNLVCFVHRWCPKSEWLYSALTRTASSWINRCFDQKGIEMNLLDFTSTWLSLSFFARCVKARSCLVLCVNFFLLGLWKRSMFPSFWWQGLTGNVYSVLKRAQFINRMCFTVNLS